MKFLSLGAEVVWIAEVSNSGLQNHVDVFTKLFHNKQQ